MEFNNRLLLKIIELGIAIACIVLWKNVDDHSTDPMIIWGTMGGYAVICGVLFIGHIINSIVEKRLNGIFSLVGCILFVASGALIINAWHNSPDLLYKERKRSALATGSLMIINGAVFLLDTLSICRTRAIIPVIREEPKNTFTINRY